MKKHLVVLIGIAVILFSSCSHRLVDFTIISTKNVDLSKSGSFKRNNIRTKGSDRSHIILIFPMGSPNMKDAIDKAIERVPGAVALVDGVVYLKSWTAILYGQSSYVVEGTPLIDPELTSNNNELPEYMYFEFDKKGNIKKQNQVTKQEYMTLKSKYIKSGRKQEEIDSINL